MNWEFLLFMICIFCIRACPDEKTIYPCTCSMSFLPEITCQNLTNERDLHRVTESLSGTKGIAVFTVSDSTFRYIPWNSFANFKFSKLIIGNSILRALSDTDVMLFGLEQSLDTLIIENCTIMEDWEWSMFKNFKNLKFLSLVGISMEDVEKVNKEELDGIEFLSLIRNEISNVNKNAFESCKLLNILWLDDNQIVEITRSMLPNPAEALEILSLKNNKIERLPNDMFTNMPELKRLDISINKLLTIDEKTFIPVWTNLMEFKAIGNEFYCDCRMQWMSKYATPKNLEAICYEPRAWAGKNILDLPFQKMWC